MSGTYPNDFAEFRAWAECANTVPLARTVPADMLTPLTAYLRIAEQSSYSFLLESIEGGEHIARYSFLGADPTVILRGKAAETHVMDSTGTETTVPINAFEYLRRHFAGRTVPIGCKCLPLAGGAVGYFGYNAAHWFEPAVPAAKSGGHDAVFALFRTVIAFDHARQSAEIQTVVFTDEASTPAELELLYRQAQERLDAWAARLTGPLPAQREAKQHIVAEACSSNFTKPAFETAVAQIKELIAAGEVYQTVLSQRFSRPTSADAIALYRALRRTNPSPYTFLLNFPGEALIGASPEMLVRCRGRQLEYRPIAGTRPRSNTPQEDARLAQELLADEKERAEHVMLVDLGRNDLGRVAEYGSVQVDRFMDIEKFSHVQHIVSQLSAKLRPDRDCFDAFAACFPAGTVTGAPKIRAMQAIAKLEPTPRGPYSGAVFYADYASNLDSCITIRTIQLKDGIASMQAGAGIVADSLPAAEYEETINKARAMQQAITLAEMDGQA